MDNKQYKIHLQEVKRLNKSKYFREITYDPQSVVNTAFLFLADNGIEYNQETFFKTLRAVMSHENYIRIKSNKWIYQNHLKYGNVKKSEYRKKATDWYIKHLLSKKYSIEEINANPDLIAEKKKEILNLRKNNNQPTENELPKMPDELTDLSLINPDYKGYAITTYGELYSCKALFKTDVMFTTQWRPIAKRNNGCIRLNIKGVKKEIGIKSVLNTLQNQNKI